LYEITDNSIIRQRVSQTWKKLNILANRKVRNLMHTKSKCNFIDDFVRQLSWELESAWLKKELIVVLPQKR
jgi:type VI protein secretion system component VasF